MKRYETFLRLQTAVSPRSSVGTGARWQQRGDGKASGLIMKVVSYSDTSHHREAGVNFRALRSEPTSFSSVPATLTLLY